MNKSLTRENKKQQILDYIDKTNLEINRLDPFQLSKIFIKRRYKDKYYTEKEINLLLEELKDEGLIDSGIIKIDIVYPKSHKKEVFKRWKNFLRPYDDMAIAMILYLIIIFATYIFKRDKLDSAIMFPLILFIGYKLFHWFYNFISNKITFIRNINSKLLLSILISILILIGIIFVSFPYLGGQFSVTLLLSCIIGGAAVGGFVYKIVLNKD